MADFSERNDHPDRYLRTKLIHMNNKKPRILNNTGLFALKESL